MKKSNKYEVVKRLTNRFKLQESGNAMLQLGDDVIPITSADELLKTPEIATASLNLTAASGRTVAFTVPANKRWRLWHIYRGGSTAQSSVGIQKADTTTFTTFSTTIGTAAVSVNSINYPMDTGWTIVMDNTNNGADSGVSCKILYEEEDAY